MQNAEWEPTCPAESLFGRRRGVFGLPRGGKRVEHRRSRGRSQGLESTSIRLGSLRRCLGIWFCKGFRGDESLQRCWPDRYRGAAELGGQGVQFGFGKVCGERVGFEN